MNVGDAPLARRPLGEAEKEIHGNPQGYTPGWRWVSPPGVGDAPQHIYTTFSLYPLSVDGPGDRPATYLKIGHPPVIQNFAQRQLGYAVTGGRFLLSGLYQPRPMTSYANEVYPFHAGGPVF